MCISLTADELVVSSFAESTEAPHEKGNLYAPEIVKVGDELLMYFGAQGKDGHDRIHLATSSDGQAWKQEGVVFGPEGVNHVNDPSVVFVGGNFYMFYTRAGVGVTDAIGLAVSKNGRSWTDKGSVLNPSPAPAWDSLLVGRPSVLHDGKKFHLWYDGRKDLPPLAPDSKAPKSDTSRRFVGYAVSSDGVNWEKKAEPVFGEDAGGIHVVKAGEGFLMVIESRNGTKWATSKDGLKWKSRGLLHAKDANSPHGHVTPFLHRTKNSWRLFYGAAKAETWNENSIYAAVVDPEELFKTSE